MGLGKFLVVEGIDIFEVTVQSEEKLCGYQVRGCNGFRRSVEKLAHLLDQRPLPHSQHS